MGNCCCPDKEKGIEPKTNGHHQQLPAMSEPAVEYTSNGEKDSEVKANFQYQKNGLNSPPDSPPDSPPESPPGSPPDSPLGSPPDSPLGSPPEKPGHAEYEFGKEQDDVRDDSSISIDMEQFNRFTVWGVEKEFGEQNDEHCEIKMAKGIAVSGDGTIALTEHNLERVYLFNDDGSYKLTVASSGENDNKHAKLLYPTDVAFTAQGLIAVSDQSKYVKVFNLDGSFVHRFNIKGDDDDAESKPKAYSIEATSSGHILVGDIRRKLIAIHHDSDGESQWIRNVSLGFQPHFLAANVANGRYQILGCDWRAGVVTALDLEGAVDADEENVIFTLDSFTVDGKPALPKGLACDDGNNIYIAVSKLDDSADNKNVFTDTGHIHQYSPSGHFERCIFKGLFHPRGLAWYNGTLYVANTRSVVIVNGT